MLPFSAIGCPVLGDRMCRFQRSDATVFSDRMLPFWVIGWSRNTQFSEEVLPLIKKIGLIEDLDEGCIALKNAHSIEHFVKQCKKLRYHQREEALM
jgi:hypothetical protein